MENQKDNYSCKKSANVQSTYFLVIGLLGERICTEISSILRGGWLQVISRKGVTRRR